MAGLRHKQRHKARSRLNPLLKFDGGGYVAGGKAMFDSECNLWVGDNFSARWQGQDSLWQGNATKFKPNGKPLSPITTGFGGGGK
jgi:hypothetical protein